MTRAALLLALMALTACNKTYVEDNSPTRRERETAYENCTGEQSYRHDKVAPALRVLCTFAVYGGAA